MTELDPQLIEALRAEPCAAEGERSRAVELLSRAVTADPQDGLTQLNLGIALQGAGHHNDALKFFTSAQKLLANDPVAFLHAAISLLSLNQTQKALHAASEACKRGPRLAQAHYVYGQAWLPTSDPVKAERAFAEAIQLNPVWADAWVNYGIARYRQGAIEDAKTAMRQALKSAPGHAAATTNLGAFMRISGEADSGRAAAARNRSREPQNIGARLNLAADFLQDERAADALALLDGAEPATSDPRAARHWYLQKSLALLQLGRAAEAKAVLDALAARGPISADIAPLWYWRQVLLARAEERTFRAPADGMRRRIGGGAVGDGPRRRARTSDHGALRSRQVLVGAERLSGARVRALAVAGHQACSNAASRFRATRTAPSSTPISPLFDKTPPSPTAPARAQRRSGADLHRRHAAFRHDIMRTNSRRAPRRPWRRRTHGAAPCQCFAALGGA